MKTLLTAIFMAMTTTALVFAQSNVSDNITMRHNGTEDGFTVNNVNLTDDVRLSAWCWMSRGNFSGGALEEYATQQIPFLSTGLNLLRMREGEIMCIARARSDNEAVQPSLAWSAAWFADGERAETGQHTCRLSDNQCLHKWGHGTFAMGPRAEDNTDALALCFDVTDQTGNTLASLTASVIVEDSGRSENAALPEGVGEAHGALSSEACSARRGDWGG